MHRVAEDGEALAHRVQDDGFVIHFHLDKVGRDEVALVVDSNVQVVGRNIGSKAIRASKGRG